MSDNPLSSRLSALLAIAIWMCLSSVVILFNKWILDSFPFPVTLTTWHMFCATVFTQILARTTNLIDTKTKVDAGLYLRTFVPIGVCFSMSLVLSNMVYLYLSMSFIQMLKALGPVATLLAGWSLGLRNPKPSLRVFVNVCVIVAGVMLASFGELKFVLAGLFIQLAAVVFEAYKNALQQYLLGGKINMSSMTLLYYFAPVCTLTNTILIIILEARRLQASAPFAVSPRIFLANGLVTFSLNIASVQVIKKTSSVVLTLSGIPKAIILMVLDMLMYHSQMSLLQAIGFSIAGAGTVYYSRLRETDKQVSENAERKGRYESTVKSKGDVESQVFAVKPEKEGLD